jgi:branched-chain amino acid transport system ATP-binding protein
VFPSLSVRENLQVAARAGPGARRWSVEAVFELFPHLAARQANRGNQLSGGEQQMLSIGRALMGNPSVLLLDEPSEGLSPLIVEELVRALKRLRDEESMSCLLVEQNTRVALGFSPRALVMNRGRIVYDGSSEALARDRARLDALIGVAGGVEERGI